MKKIIAAIDGLKFSESTTKHAIHLAKLAHAHLVGVFLDDFTYHSYKIYELAGEEGYDEGRRRILEAKDQHARDTAVAEFEKSCQDAGIPYTVHHDRSIAIQELLHESIYADLLVINQQETLTHYEEPIPTRFIRDLLSEVQCPVLVVSSVYIPFNKVVLLYDGEPSSVFAIKAFSYVLPCLKSLETEVVSVNSNRQSLHLPDNRLMKEFMKRHYPNASYTVLKGVPETEILQYIKPRRSNELIVLGAYKRGMVSRWFRASMADILMQETALPLFIAHNK